MTYLKSFHHLFDIFNDPRFSQTAVEGDISRQLEKLLEEVCQINSAAAGFLSFFEVRTNAECGTRIDF